MAEPKTIAVTGASRGIGAAIARELARRGYTVACLTRKGSGPEDGGPAHAGFVNEACDVNDEAGVRRALAAVVSRTGNLHGLVNNAGVHRDAPSHAMSTGLYEEVMATNAKAVFVACREAYPHLAASGGGLIVNIGSFFDKIGVKRNLAYCASKAAVGAITRVLAVEWAGKGIRVINVAPGYILTDLNADEMALGGPLRTYLEKRIPGKEPGTAADVGALVVSLFGPAGAFLTGETIYMDGGQGIAY